MPLVSFFVLEVWYRDVTHTRVLLYRANPYCFWTSLANGMCSLVHWTGQWLSVNVFFWRFPAHHIFQRVLCEYCQLSVFFHFWKHLLFGANDGYNIRLYWCHICMCLSLFTWYWDHQVIKSQKLQDKVPGFALFLMRMGRQVWPIYPSTKSPMRNIKEFRCAGFECQ